ncbi:hypothetical protein, partial [Thauera aromatica]|uniref:hypothetical protein n=1 Tax=Thauera aromatica TaxID=59405 RepID=UPI001FFD122D
LPLARAIPGALDPPAASGKTGSMKPTLWKTKNRGKLKELLAKLRVEECCAAAGAVLTRFLTAGGAIRFSV